jgi:hypothetical protein
MPLAFTPHRPQWDRQHSPAPAPSDLMTPICPPAARVAGGGQRGVAAPAVHHEWARPGREHDATGQKDRTRVVPRPRSIRARYTLAATVLSLIAVATVGVGLALVIRYRVDAEIFKKTEQAAGHWSAAARNGTVPSRIPTVSDVDLIQVVDAHGRV